MWNVFYPHFLINNVAELTPERLRELDVENLLLDVDCTLKQYENQGVPQKKMSRFYLSIYCRFGIIGLILTNKNYINSSRI